MARDVIDRLQDISQSLSDLDLLKAGLNKADFIQMLDSDRKTYLAIQAALIQLGEATKALPLDVTQRHIDVPWRDIAGMRDVLVHHYFKIEAQIIWDTISGEDLILLKHALTLEFNRAR